jgi:hypothetical protein
LCDNDLLLGQFRPTTLIDDGLITDRIPTRWEGGKMITIIIILAILAYYYPVAGPIIAVVMTAMMIKKMGAWPATVAGMMLCAVLMIGAFLYEIVVYDGFMPEPVICMATLALGCLLALGAAICVIVAPHLAGDKAR